MHEKGDTHALAVERLRAARAERERCSQEYDAATGSSTRADALTELQAAEEQLAAREAWLLWLDRDY